MKEKHDNALLIFTKPPIPGQVKTRLMPALSHENAAALADALLALTLSTSLAVKNCHIELFIAGDDSHPFFHRYQQCPSISTHVQVGENLGERLKNAIKAAFSRYKRVIIIGSDCPLISTAYLDNAFQQLNKSADIVIGPAQDGGYVLLGLNTPQLSLFTDIPWSSDRVFAVTNDRINALNLKSMTLPTLWDIDIAEDLEKFTTWYHAHQAEIAASPFKSHYAELFRCCSIIAV